MIFFYSLPMIILLLIGYFCSKNTNKIYRKDIKYTLVDDDDSYL
jgi:hypothetical protein